MPLICQSGDRDNVMSFLPTYRLFFKQINACRRLHVPRFCCAQEPASKASGRPIRPQRHGKSDLRPPRDLVHFRRSRFVAHCNELRHHRLLPSAVSRDPPTRLSIALSTAGRIHEDRVAAHLSSIIEHPDPLHTIPFAHRDRNRLTREAIESRVPLIRGAALSNNLLDGYSDILILSALDPFLTPSQRARVHPNAYSVCEVKLATVHRSDHILQAASYFCMLNQLLSRLNIPHSTHAYLWLGNLHNDPIRLPSRTLEYLFSTTAAKYSQFLKHFKPNSMVMPDGPLMDMVPWKNYAIGLLEMSDSLNLVAGIRRSQVSQIVSATAMKTLSSFARLPTDKVQSLINHRKLPPMARRLHRQAALQLETRLNADQTTAFEISPNILYTLPPVSPNDVYFDIEGFPLMQDGGLEYLFGVQCEQEGSFRAWWAHTRSQEESAFINLINWIHQRIVDQPSTSQPIPHIFHYGHYEVTALRRIGMRAVSADGMRAAVLFEALVDRGAFFDVYKFVKSSLVIGESSYSIKKVEKLAGISRDGDDVADAESSIGMYFEWRRQCFDENTEVNCAPDDSSHPILNEILLYNKQDCESLGQVIQWLRVNIPESMIVADACDPSASEEDSDNANELSPGACGRTSELRMADSDAIVRSGYLSETFLRLNSPYLNTHATQSLAHILQFYAKESAPDRRLFRDRVQIASTPLFEDLFYDEKCIVGAKLKGVTRNPLNPEKELFAYSFNRIQPVVLSSGESMAFVIPSRQVQTLNDGGDKKANIALFVTVKSFELEDGSGNGRLLLSFGNKKDISPPTFGVLVSSNDLTVCDAPLRQSVMRRAEDLAEAESGGEKALAHVFLNRETLDEDGKSTEEEWVRRFGAGEFNSDSVCNFLASREDRGVFVLQGPPGTGKTFLSGQLISQLITQHNKTVAVTSNSHAAIDNLLGSAVEAGVNCDMVWKVGTRMTGDTNTRFKANIRDLRVSPLTGKGKGGTAEGEETIEPKASTKGTRKRRRSSHAVLVGATCYQLCREENDDKFDFLFIDEASQVTMAHFLAVSASARYAVLAGDQQQLEMPIKGAHFGGIGQSCLSYIVGKDVSTVSPKRGIFLGTSYRMNPGICDFVSESFYGGALVAASSCGDNVISGETEVGCVPEKFRGGICFLPCENSAGDGTMEANETGLSRFGKWHRPGEVTAILKVIQELVGKECSVRGVSKRLEERDFLVVAPYNAQVRALRAAVGDGVRVGTVDKFQGQEAAVALISTCTSADGGDADDAHGDFRHEGDFADSDGVGGSGDWDFGVDGGEHRGMRFCLQRNRLNVAISRAQCLAVVVGDRDACVKLPLNQLDDIATAALFEHLVSTGQGHVS